MSNVKISPAPPFGLPAAATLTGAELVPMDQTTAGITTTVKASVSAIVALAAAGVTSFNTRTGAVTLTSGDVTTALGYVPLSSFNGRTGPAITLTSSDVTTALGFTPLSAALTSFNTRTGPAITLTSADVTTALGFTPGTSSAVGATPTALVGLTAIAGTSGNFTRSDGAPALNQGISPTWTGLHLYTGSGGLGVVMANTIGIGFKDSGGATNTELQLFSDNQVYLDNNSSGAAINLRVGAGFAGLHVNMFGVQLDAPQTTGGDTLTVAANADLTGILINGSANNIGLTINNGQSGSSANWRIMSSATGSGFGAGNLVIGTGSNKFASFASNGQLILNNAIGSTYGGSYVLSNSSAGATNTQKTWRINPTGGLELINSAFSAVIMAVADNSNFSVSASGASFGFSGPSAGLTLNQIAATQINALTIQQSGQQQWVLYQPASDNTLRLFAGSDIAVFSASSTTLVVNGIASNYAFQASGVSTGNGARINAGNAFAQAALNVDNFNATAQLFQVHGDGTVDVGGPSGGALGAGWVNAASGYAVNGVPISSSGIISNGLTTSQGITSSSTLTSSSGLSIPTSIPVGVYQFEAFISVSEVTSSTGGFKFDMAGGGATIANINVIRQFLLATGSSISADLIATLSNVQSFGTISTTSSLPTAILLSGQMQVTTAGSFAIRVAQQNPTANTTTIAAGSYVKFTKVA